MVRLDKGIASKTITEYAAIALAMAQSSDFSGLRFREVAQTGDRGDYWVEDSQTGMLVGICECSGTVAEKKLKPRYKEKRRQVRKNATIRMAWVSVSSMEAGRMGLGYYCRVR